MCRELFAFYCYCSLYTTVWQLIGKKSGKSEKYDYFIYNHLNYSGLCDIIKVDNCAYNSNISRGDHPHSIYTAKGGEADERSKIQ